MIIGKMPVYRRTGSTSVNAASSANLLADTNTFKINTATVTGSASEDLMNIVGAENSRNYGFFVAQLMVDDTLALMNRECGENTAAFASLRSATAIVNDGGNENILLPGLMANLVSTDRLQFIGGTIYETNAFAGVQAALMFEGIFKRLPDATSAGGFVLVAP